MADVDVLVVGAGPVGLTAAAELRRHGVDCWIVDVLPVPPAGSTRPPQNGWRRCSGAPSPEGLLA